MDECEKGNPPKPTAKEGMLRRVSPKQVKSPTLQSFGDVAMPRL
ncbi:MAG: hypothetical protein ABSG99_02170 [Sedimentisphaerales bacterium]